MATEKFTNKPQQSFVSGGDRVASHALYIATVKATADNERMGRIRVFVMHLMVIKMIPKHGLLYVILLLFTV